MVNKLKLRNKLDELSLREIDILVAKFFYGCEVKTDRVYSKNSNFIKYLWVPPKKKKYSRNFSKSRTKTEKENDKYRPLPRWSTDIRDCWNLVKLTDKKFGAMEIKVLDKSRTSVILLGEKFEGSFCSSVTRAILFNTLLEKENENQ